MSRRYISIAEAAEYLGISTKFVRNLIVEGEIKGYRIGSHARHRTLRVDLDEIDEKLMQPVGAYWNDPTARPRKRKDEKPAPDRSTAIKRVEESATVNEVTAERKPRQSTLWCKCGHGDGAHGKRTTYGPGVDPPKPRYRCWNCECKHFDEDINRRRRQPKKHQG